MSGLLYGGDKQFTRHIKHAGPVDAQLEDNNFQPDGLFIADEANYLKLHRLVSSIDIRVVRAADESTFADEATTVVMPGQEFTFCPTAEYPGIAWSRVSPITITDVTSYGVIEDVVDETLTLADDVDGLDAGDYIRQNGLQAIVTDASGSPDIEIDENPGFELGAATFHMQRFEDGEVTDADEITLDADITGLTTGDLIIQGTLSAEIVSNTAGVLVIDEDPGFEDGEFQFEMTRTEDIDAIPVVIELEAEIASLAADDVLYQRGHTCTVVDVTMTTVDTNLDGNNGFRPGPVLAYLGGLPTGDSIPADFFVSIGVLE